MDEGRQRRKEDQRKRKGSSQGMESGQCSKSGHRRRKEGNNEKMGFSGRPMKTAHPASLVKDSLVVQSCNKIFGNTLIDTNMSERDNRVRQCSEEYFLRQLKTEKPYTIIRDLHIWVHESQKEEICAGLIRDLTRMNEKEQKIYLNYL